MSLTVPEPRPSYVPAGYGFAYRVVGQSAGGFWGSADQVLLAYVTGGGPGVPLALFAVPRGGEETLHATERRQGQSIDLGVNGVGAVYHDGIWQLGPGPDQQQAGRLIVHWDQSDMHSITIVAGDHIFAVRGARSRGISYDELCRIAASLPLS